MHSKTPFIQTLKTCKTTPHTVYDTYICSNSMKICMRMINTEFGVVFALREGREAYGASIISEILI